APPGFPGFLNSFSVIVAKKNTVVELECRTSGDPPPEISWYKNSVPIDLTDPRFTKLDDGNLKISNLIEDDEGKYECAATNQKGTRLSSGDNLLVRAKRFRPHFTNIPNPRYVVSPGGRLSLTCTAVGAPVPTVDWYRGTRRLEHEKLDNQPPGTARIMLLDLSESINVTCVAESNMGRIYHDVQVVVKNLPPPPQRIYLIDVSATHARLAFTPSKTDGSTTSTSTTTSSTILKYLIFWIPTEQFDNQTFHTMSNQVMSLLHPSLVVLDSTTRTDG
ncbi:Receptor-type tyrosine-protein phosphatase S, partial [Paragonimus heterotremus]